jgi:fructose-bisphosphate aldolase class II
MTLVSIKNDLIKARKNGYAVPLFDVFDLQGVEGVMDALIEKRAPTIFAIYSQFVDLPYAPAMAAYIRRRAEDTDVSISLMLDHGTTVDLCKRALDVGFTDVMYDGSALSLEENIANTRLVVTTAKAYGAAVEAELGHVGYGDQYDIYGKQRIGFTNPDFVENFVDQTGIDFLAIAFGNAHGFYKGEPHLDLQLLAEIKQRVSVPLVMHGGTGISDEQFRAAITGGISKVNFATAIMNGAVENMRQIVRSEKALLFEVTEGIRVSYREWSSRMYDVFGTTGKA